MNTTLLWAFVGAAVLICLVPGPDMLFILASALTGGGRAGAVAAAGMAVGVSVHTTLAVLGLSALLRSAPSVYLVVQLAGAAYLLWLAVTTFRHAPLQAADGAVEANDGADGGPGAAGGVSLRRVLLRAVVTNLANPKVIVFYVAFLPQFVDRDRGHVTIQLLVLGLVLLVVGLVIDTGVGLAAGAVRAALLGRAAVGRLFSRVAGTIYGALAVRLVVDR